MEWTRTAEGRSLKLVQYETYTYCFHRLLLLWRQISSPKGPKNSQWAGTLSLSELLSRVVPSPSTSTILSTYVLALGLCSLCPGEWQGCSQGCTASVLSHCLRHYSGHEPDWRGRLGRWKYPSIACYSWAVIDAAAPEFVTPKTFVCVSTIMTWAKTKPNEQVGASHATFT